MALSKITNSGIGAIDTLAVDTDTLVVDSTNNRVGIGTSSPLRTLDIQADSGTNIPLIVRGGSSQTNAFIAIRDTNTTGDFYNRIGSVGDNLVLYTNQTERMRIDSSGNLKFNSGYGSVATAYGCRAWVNFNGTGIVAIRASGNVSSITDNGTGNYTVNLTTALPDVNYAVTFGAPSFNPGNPPWVFQEDFNTARTTSSFRMWTNQSSNSYDSDFVQLAIIR